MHCDTFQNLLHANRDLTAEERQAMKEHLASCPDCALWAAIREDARTMDRQEEMPKDFSAAWRKAIRQETVKQGASRPLVRLLRSTHAQRVLSTAAVAVLILGGLFLSRNLLWPSLAPESASEGMALKGVHASAAPVFTQTPAPQTAENAQDALPALGDGAQFKGLFSLRSNAAPEEDATAPSAAEPDGEMMDWADEAMEEKMLGDAPETAAGTAPEETYGESPAVFRIIADEEQMNGAIETFVQQLGGCVFRSEGENRFRVEIPQNAQTLFCARMAEWKISYEREE